MRTLDGRTFGIAVVAGLIATFVMTMTGFWQAGLGLPPVDVGGMLSGSMNGAHPDGEPYGIVAGNLAHFANGVVLALIFVAFLQRRLPGGWLLQGLIYAVLTTLAAALVVVPLAAGDRERTSWPRRSPAERALPRHVHQPRVLDVAGNGLRVVLM